MKTVWTIKYGEEQKPLKVWGVENVSRHLRLQAQDELTFLHTKAQADADPLFAPESTLMLYRDDVPWFSGYVLDVQPSVEDQTEGHRYTVVGPWYYLENHVFKQKWKTYTGDPDNLTDVFVSHLLLGTKVVATALVRMHMREQIEEILEYAIDSGTPMQYDLGDLPEIFLPTDEMRDQSCAEALRRQLRWVPDIVTAWDYTVTPPKLTFRKRDNIERFDLKAFGGMKSVARFTCRRRYDLKRPSVVIRYELVNTDNGEAREQHATDSMPLNSTGNELRALMLTIDLQGYSRTTSSVELVTAPIDTAEVNWWKDRVSWMADDEITSIVISGVTRSGVLHLPNELVDGSFPPWLEDQGRRFEMETFQATAKVKFQNGSVREEVVSVDINSTNAESRAYTTVDSFVEGDPIPVGLANEFWTLLNRPEYQGDILLVEQDCSGMLVSGDVFRITDGREEWNAMRALVSEVTENIDTGETVVSFGPAEHLGPADLVHLMTANRWRFVYTSPSRRANAQVGLDNRLDLAKTTGKRNSTSGTKKHERLVVKTTVSEQNGSIDVDAAATIYEGVARPIAPRVMAVCVPNGDGTFTTKKVMGMLSEVF